MRNVCRNAGWVVVVRVCVVGLELLLASWAGRVMTKLSGGHVLTRRANTSAPQREHESKAGKPHRVRSNTRILT